MSTYLPFAFVIIPVQFAISYGVGMYRPVLQYTGLELLYTSIKTVTLSFSLFFLAASVLEFFQFPRSVLLMNAVLTLILMVGMRVFMRWVIYDISQLMSQQDYEKVIIYGAGRAGSQLANALLHEQRYKVIAFVDDNPQLQNQVIKGLRIHPPQDLARLLEQEQLQTVLLAIPSASRKQRHDIVQQLRPLGVAIKTVPGLGEIISGKVTISEIRNIDITDLLGREEVLPEPQLLRQNITEKTVLVTGAGGSIGSELCRQIAQQSPKQLILCECNEFALYSIDMELGEHYPELKKISALGSVTDQKWLFQILNQYGVDTIYHAAAYKHVPLVEANPAQAVINTVQGTLSAARAAIACHVETFVLISTDKAVRPTSVMGTTKRVSELILQAFSQQPGHKTHFVMVRFGNVLNSTGSVVPRFRKQIMEGKPITLTHPEVTRYFMSISEASRLVIQAGAMGRGGEVFLLDMGEPVKIYDLATQMIELSGLVPGKDIEIQITGLRPGEKLYEELLINGENIQPTLHPKIYCAQEALLPWQQLFGLLEKLFEAARHNETASIIQILQQLVPEYTPDFRPNLQTPASVTSEEVPQAIPEVETQPTEQLKYYITLRQTEKAKQLLKEIGESLPSATRWYYEGAICGDRWESRKALRCYMESLSHLESIEDREERDYVRFRATRALAITKCKLGEDFEGALNLLENLLQHPFVQTSPKHQQQIQTTIAVVHYYNKEYETTVCQMQSFIDSQASSENHIWLSQCYLFMALSYGKLQQKDLAQHYFCEALMHFLKLSAEKVNNPHFLFDWIGWIPLTQEFKELHPEIVDQVFAENIMQQFSNGFMLYQGVSGDDANALPKAEAIKQSIFSQLFLPKKPSKIEIAHKKWSA